MGVYLCSTNIKQVLKNKATVEELQFIANKNCSVTLVKIQQERKLISSLGNVLVNVWKDFIEHTCLRNVTNA